VALPLGKMRLRPGGSSTHNGLRSLRDHLGTDQFPRLRLGIGEPRRGSGQDLAEYVLDPFAQDEQGLVSEMERRAAQVLDVWLTEGLERAMEEAQK
jgi:peptidyl-tRNA hydrolase, PTH1 family